MPVVEELDVALADGSRRRSQHLWPGWRQQQVDMIVHQDEGVDGDGVSSAGFMQQLAVVVPVFVIDENGGAVDAALGDVERNVWQDQACSAWHGKRRMMAGIQCLDRWCCAKSGK